MTPTSPAPRSRLLEPRQCPDNLLSCSPEARCSPQNSSPGRASDAFQKGSHCGRRNISKLSSVSPGTKVALCYCLVMEQGEGHEPCVLSLHCPSSMDSKHRTRCFLDSSLEGEQVSSHLFIHRRLLSALPSGANSLKSGAPLFPSARIPDKLFNLSQGQISHFQNENSFTALQTFLMTQQLNENTYGEVVTKQRLPTQMGFIPTRISYSKMWL